MMSRFRAVLVALCALLALLAFAPATAGAAQNPSIGHVFLILLENENAETSFGAGSPAPYLARTLPSLGAFIPNYYGVTHVSLGNYIALVSGQGSNPQTQADCMVYTEFSSAGQGPDGQELGQGCVYPTSVPTLMDQLATRKLTWKGYMEDMGKDPTRESATCGHPELGQVDNTQTATPIDQYATRHNPFVYFHSIIDSPICATNDVALTRLPNDLRTLRSTPNYVFITPNLCHDGHDAPCKNGEPGGLVSADRWLHDWIPVIMRSPAYRHDGLIVVTFDEAEAGSADADASACCNEAQFPNTLNNGGPIPGMGGGRVGAVALSPFIDPGTVTNTAYNHFSLLRSVEDLFGLPHIGYARTPSPGSFGTDVFTGL
jgi:phosphatidylinositol-3-phosphatase